MRWLGGGVREGALWGPKLKGEQAGGALRKREGPVRAHPECRGAPRSGRMRTQEEPCLTPRAGEHLHAEQAVSAQRRVGGKGAPGQSGGDKIRQLV